MSIVERSTADGAPPGQARYVAIVCDGSARWASARGATIIEGHEAAADTVLARIADAIALGVRELTFYAFSTENWARPRDEVEALMEMLARRIELDTPLLDALGVGVSFIGRRDRGGQRLADAMNACEAATKQHPGMRVFVAVDYGGRDEIVRAAERYEGGGEKEFSHLLQSAAMHDPDLLIRTSGEQRLSNFLLWQAAYAELVFRPELWPDFKAGTLEECLVEYALRTRRFGARKIVSPAPGSAGQATSR